MTRRAAQETIHWLQVAYSGELGASIAYGATRSRFENRSNAPKFSASDPKSWTTVPGLATSLSAWVAPPMQAASAE